MSLSVEFETAHANPLDRVEHIAQQREWPLERIGREEVVMAVAGNWFDLSLSLNWRDDLESILVASAYELKVPARRRPEVAGLVALINVQLVHGHFEIWEHEGIVVFRNALLLTGAAEANDSQCESLISLAVDTCQRYYPAFQFAIWAGHSARQALDSALLETRGEA